MSLTRRALLGTASAVGFSSLFGGPIRRALATANPAGPFRRCVVLWMEGGPSQLDTFDPKDGGDRASLATGVAGVRFADTLPGLAKRAEDLCIVRSVGSREGEHTRATELMHTGFLPLPSFPRPAIGSMVSSGCDNPGFPRYVTLGGFGFGPAFLGSEHGPFVIEDVEAAKNQLGRVTQRRRGLNLVNELNTTYALRTYSPALAERSSSVESVRQLLGTPFPKALDLSNVSPSDRQRYGDHEFGQRVLTAKRLLALGVPFVEAQLPGWDTHIDNGRRTDSLCRLLEQPWLALMDDLHKNGMWDDTLVVWMGEFGRTPRLNGRAGRDHFPQSIPIVLAGGNLGGRVIGQTSEDGSRRVGTTHSVADLMATLMTLMGLDVDASYTTDFGSPTTATDDGTPIEQIVRA